MESKWHNRLRARIVDYLKERGFVVRTSHERTGKVPLYYDKPSRSTFTSDVDILTIKDGDVKHIIEVQDSIRPKDLIGIIGAINISTIYKSTKYPLKDVILFIVTKQYIKGSKKADQIAVILERSKCIGGCLKDTIICTETDFRDRFEKCEQK